MDKISVEDITLRRASLEDGETVFLWRNATDTRRYFFNPQEISKSDHLKWFAESCQNDNRILLIGEIEKKPVGVIRYDINKNAAEVDVYLVPGLYGHGLGTQLLTVGNRWLKFNFPNIKEIMAKVLEENISSHKAFKKAGFRPFFTVYTYPLTE